MTLTCRLCAHDCELAPGERGRCGVRHHDGTAIVPDAPDALLTAYAAPLETKRLYHVAPGALAYSFAAAGCNFTCRYCQNWMASQTPKSDPDALPTRRVGATQLVDEARAAGCRALAATFTEPTVFFETALAAAQAARAAGLLSVWKTNGFLRAEPLAQLAPWLDAVNVDLKSFSETTYRESLGGSLAPVLDALREFRRHGVWLEVTTLVVPQLNDDPGELDALAEFILQDLGPDTPWHLTRFHPDYALAHRPPTPRATLLDARERALARGLRWVYTDAEPAGEGWHTRCAGCGTLLLERAGDRLVADHRDVGTCPTCHQAPPMARAL